MAHNGALPRVTEDLSEGEALRLSWAGQAERGAAPVAQIAAWREHWLIARAHNAAVRRVTPWLIFISAL